MRPTDVRRLRGGLLSARNYRSVASALVVSTQPLETVRRYVDADVGPYPWTTTVRTPTGPLALTLSHPHDVRTLNEVFFRRDYGAERPRVVVDAGANIGVSAAYFLSRRPDSVVHCWEPVPGNLEHLRANLAPFADRVTISEHALAPEAGEADFLVEDVGRYSGLADFYEHDLDTRSVRVKCDSFADALAGVMAERGGVDLLKIDTEGSETALIASVPDALMNRIGQVVHEEHGRVRRESGAAVVRRRGARPARSA